MGRTARRGQFLLVLVGAVLLVVGTAWTNHRNTDSTVTASVIVPLVTAPPLSLGVAYLGDSYTAGAGASNSEDGFAYVMSRRMCWNGGYFGAGGTGYTTAGTQGFEPFGQRVDSIVKAQPAVVIVQGSTNDPGGPTTTAAAKDVFTRLRAGLPKATVVVVGPLAPKGVPSKVAIADRNAVQVAAAQSGLVFIDPISERWLQDDTRYFADDGIHPSKAGHSKIADLLVTKLRAAPMNMPGCTTSPS